MRKQVIQPHLPVRLPCYDFVQIAATTLGGCLPAIGLAGLAPPASGGVGSPGVTCCLYRARERIHRRAADRRLLAAPASCRRVAACNPNWGRLSRDLLRLAAWQPVVPAIVACVSPGTSGLCRLDVIPSFLRLSRRSRQRDLTGDEGCARSGGEPNASRHELTTAMQHLCALPEGSLGFRLATTRMSSPGKVLRLASD